MNTASTSLQAARGTRKRSRESTPLSEPTSYDKHFGTQRPGDALLISSTGVGFYFPASILIDQSSFFRNLSDLENAQGKAPALPDSIHLPNAKPHAVRYVLRFLKYVLRGEGELPPFQGGIMDDVLVFTDAYDVPIVSRLLYNLYVTRLTDPFELFTLAVLSGHERDARTTSTATYTKYIHEMPNWTRTVLVHWAPMHLARLHDLHSMRLPAYLNLQRGMSARSEEELYEWQSWSGRCGEGQGCITFQDYKGDMRKALEEATIACLEGFEDLGRTERVNAIYNQLHIKIRCANCYSHIRHNWEVEIHTYLQACKETIEDVSWSPSD